MILIIDNCSQMVLQFEARLKRWGITYRKISHDQPLDFDLARMTGLVLSGGPGNPYGPLNLSADFVALSQLEVPTIGFCLGFEIMSVYFGGQIGELECEHSGPETVVIDDPSDPLLSGLPREIELVKKHSLCVTSIGTELCCLAHSKTCSYEIIRHSQRPMWGFQSHPEASPGPGEIIIARFLAECGLVLPVT